MNFEDILLYQLGKNSSLLEALLKGAYGRTDLTAVIKLAEELVKENNDLAKGRYEFEAQILVAPPEPSHQYVSPVPIKKRIISTESMIEAITETKGNMAEASVLLKCNDSSLRKRYRSDEKLKEVVDELRKKHGILRQGGRRRISEEAIADAFDIAGSARGAAELLGCSPFPIRVWAKKNGIKLFPGGDHRPEKKIEKKAKTKQEKPDKNIPDTSKQEGDGGAKSVDNIVKCLNLHRGNIGKVAYELKMNVIALKLAIGREQKLQDCIEFWKEMNRRKRQET